MGRIKEMIGKKFGRLTVVERYLGEAINTNIRYFCKCDCGGERITSGSSLRSGNCESCGCLNREHMKNVHKKITKHGFSGTRTHEAYRHAKYRCGRIGDYKTTKFLFSSIEELIEDIGICPEGMLLDRKDPYGDYAPGKVRWVDASLSSSNKRLLKRNTSGAQGVNWCKRHGKWRAKISMNKKHIVLGYFDDFLEAHQEYLRFYFLKYNEYPNEFMV